MNTPTVDPSIIAEEKTNYCPAAWLEVYIESDGSVDNCCISKNKLGNADQQDIESIMSNPRSIEIRQQMIDNQPVEGCAACLKSPGNQTLRHDYLDWFKHYPKNFFKDANNFKLAYLDLRWRNTCNNACVYCSPAYSSRWASELGIREPSSQPRLENMRQLVDKRVDEIEYLYLAGGEPLMIKENEWLLEKMLKTNPKCQIVVNTSLNSIDNRIFNLLLQFDRVRWIISGESTGKQYEYVRYGSDWDLFLQNLGTLRARTPMTGTRLSYGHFITYHMVYSALTAHSIDDYMSVIKSSKEYNPVKETFSIYYINGGGGGFHDPRNLPDHVKIRNQQRLETLIAWEKRRPTNSHFLRQLESLYNIVLTPNPESQDLLRELHTLDQRRNLNSREIFPELYEDTHQ